MNRSRLAPRKSELPLFLALGFAGMIPSYAKYLTKPFWRVVYMCDSYACTVFGLGKPIGILLFWFVGAYLASTLVRRTLYSRLRLTDRFPRVFDPPTEVVVALLVVGTLSVTVWLASGYRVLYTVVGLAILYVLFCPLLTAAVLLGFLDSLHSEPAFVIVTITTVIVAQVAWWYILAYGIAGSYRRLAAHSRTDSTRMSG